MQRVPLQLPRLHLAAGRHRCATRPRRPSSPRSRPTATSWRLPEARVGTWGGFVFINPDPDGMPFEEFLGTMPEHFARWDFEHRYLQAHVAKKIRCNWKVAQEAFDEGLHLGATHPQSAPYVGDANAAVDVYGNYARQISPSGHADRGPAAGRHRDRHPQADARRARGRGPARSRSRSARTARDAMARAGRERWREVLGDEADDVSDAELVDHWNYAVFPNFHPWGGYNRIVYRFRPNGDRHDESIFEVMFLTPYRGERPPTARGHRARLRRAVDGRARAADPRPWSWSRTRSTWRPCSAGWSTTRQRVCDRPRTSRKGSSRGGTTC